MCPSDEEAPEKPVKPPVQNSVPVEPVKEDK